MRRFDELFKPVKRKCDVVLISHDSHEPIGCDEAELLHAKAADQTIGWATGLKQSA